MTNFEKESGYQNQELMMKLTITEPRAHQEQFNSIAAIKEFLESGIRDPTSYQKVHQISCFDVEDPRVTEFVALGIPVVMKKCSLVQYSVGKWDIPYLEKSFGDRKLDVKTCKSRYFRYSSNSNNAIGWESFAAPTRYTKMTFAEYLAAVGGLDPEKTSEAANIQHIENQVQNGVENGSGEKQEEQQAQQQQQQPEPPQAYFYLQEGLEAHLHMTDDFRQWNWNFVLDICRKNGWGLPQTNLLLVGQKGATTPCHYDEQENVFCQVRGRKRVLLFPPVDFTSLCPYPYGHPCDRQAMVNVDSPDLQRYPEFRNSHPFEYILGPGDVLYLPALWWHHFENIDHLATSVTFWCHQAKCDIAKPLAKEVSDSLLVSVRRNIEKIVMDQAGHSYPKQFEMMLSVLNEPNGVVRKQLMALLMHILHEDKATRVLDELVRYRFQQPMEFYFSPSLADLPCP
jgi:hypoxia-inducible factor 1-alpha inhibitor (HIF hydroxylase)